MKQHDIIISGINMDLTESIKKIVLDKAEKLFNHTNQIVRMRVELEHDQHKATHCNEFIAKGHLEVSGNDHHASASTDDLYKSIDDLIHKLDRMLRRRSRKLKVKRLDTSCINA